MTPPYYYLDLASIPPIPRDILYRCPLGECTRKTPDLSYGYQHYLPTGQRLWPASYTINTFMSPELVQWVEQHVQGHPKLASIDLTRITLQTQHPYPGEISSHIVHSDIGREWCLFYTLRTGGANIKTRWYQEHDQPIRRAKTGPTGQADTGVITYDRLTILEEVELQPEHWYVLNISVLHDVQGIERARQSLRIYCEPNID